MPRSAVGALAAEPAVVSVTPDTSLRLHTTSNDPVSDTGSMYNSAGIIGAPGAWNLSGAGSGVDVALIDSGIADVPGLNGSGKVVRGPDLSFDSQSAGTPADGFGHGTHMAGIIAARDDNEYTNGKLRPNGYYGIAPEARVVSVKVADRNGAAYVSRSSPPSTGGPEPQRAGAEHPGDEPVVRDRACRATRPIPSPSRRRSVAQRDRRGHLGGNSGSASGRLASPAYNPHLIAVGADDTRGTNSISDDEIPSWSSRGDGIRNPDLVAPGRSIQGLRAPGSRIDSESPEGRLGERFFRSSGSSQAAAMVSGIVALMLGRRPALTPDQVKDVLMRTARPLPAADLRGQGAGSWTPTGP